MQLLELVKEVLLTLLHVVPTKYYVYLYVYINN